MIELTNIAQYGDVFKMWINIQEISYVHENYEIDDFPTAKSIIGLKNSHTFYIKESTKEILLLLNNAHPGTVKILFGDN